MKTSSQKRTKELKRIKHKPSHVSAKLVHNERAPVSAPAAKHILVPIDFSEQSVHALEYAEAIAKQNGGTLTLLNVVEPLPGWQDAPLAFTPDKLAKEAEARLQAIARQRKIDPRLIGRTVVRVGAPWDEITRTARDLERDLIVIATHGWTGFKHVLLGSTAERVVRHATCPVLVVR